MMKRTYDLRAISVNWDAKGTLGSVDVIARGDREAVKRRLAEFKRIAERCYQCHIPSMVITPNATLPGGTD